MKALTVVSLIFFIGPIFGLKNSYDKFNVERNGHLVKMKIETLPASCIGAKVPYFVTFNYNGRVYDKQTRGAFCEEHHVGDLVDMKFLEDADNILFPKEPAWFDLLSCVFLSVVGLVIFISQLKKNKNNAK